MREIQAIGRMFTINNDGTVKNIASFENIDPIWGNVLADIINKYKIEYGDAIHSIYLRGSVASGSAVPNFSDIDTYALVYTADYIRWKEVEWAYKFQKELQAKYDFVNQIDLCISSYVENIYDTNSKLAMVMKTQSCCLFGESLIDTIKDFKTDYEMILNLPWLKQGLEGYIKTGHNSSEFPAKSAEIAKLTIRSGFELIMEQINQYTNSLYCCVVEFGKIYPDKAGDMEKLLYYYLNPSLFGEESNKIIKEMVAFIILEVNRLKLLVKWN